MIGATTELLIGLEELAQCWQTVLDRGVRLQAAADPFGQFVRAVLACIALIEQYNRAVVSYVSNAPTNGLIDCTIGLQRVPANVKCYSLMLYLAAVYI